MIYYACTSWLHATVWNCDPQSPHQSKVDCFDSIKFNKFYSSWWLNQPIWKIWSSNWIISPGRVKIRNIWNHHLVFITWENLTLKDCKYAPHPSLHRAARPNTNNQALACRSSHVLGYGKCRILINPEHSLRWENVPRQIRTYWNHPRTYTLSHSFAQIGHKK